jgi:hypothetical protein
MHTKGPLKVHNDRKVHQTKNTVKLKRNALFNIYRAKTHWQHSHYEDIYALLFYVIKLIQNADNRNKANGNKVTLGH